MNRKRPERLIIRPPSEWRSILLRVVRGCRWNRCRFCGIYPALGQESFSERSSDEIFRDIDLLKQRFPDAKTIFIGDADPLGIPLEKAEKVLSCIRSSFPSLHRCTAYARASTLWKLRQQGIGRLARAGLSRVHIGLESGDSEILRFHRKGQTPEMVNTITPWLKQEGIEVSFYVLLGLGGKNRWERHIEQTAKICNRTHPDFIRLRRLWIYSKNDPGVSVSSPLLELIDKGQFIPQTEEGTVKECYRFVSSLAPIRSYITCDHANNYIRIDGYLHKDKQRMLRSIDSFLSQPASHRTRLYEATGSRI
jgi:hypothetical protein